MTGTRPEDGAAWGERDEPHARPGAPEPVEAAPETPGDPLTDPLTGPASQPLAGPLTEATAGPSPGLPTAPAAASPFGPAATTRPEPPADPLATPFSGPLLADLADLADPTGLTDPPPRRKGRHARPPEPAPPQPSDPYGVYEFGPPESYQQPYQAPPADPETVALRRPQIDQDTMGLALPQVFPGPGPGSEAGPGPGPAAGGPAARRRAAQGRPSAIAPAATPTPSLPGDPGVPVPGGRAARRKAAKAARQTGSAIGNVIGELFITTGVLLLLFVVYQLWWTNVEARAHADGERDELQEQWGEEDPGQAGARDPGAFEPGEGFAILYIPDLDVSAPIAEGTDEESVLDNGMVGHYAEQDGLPTAMPWEEQGNVGLAGHRNTHGEPFRYINTLEPGDPIVIETAEAYYVYEMTSRLDSTLPSNISVLDPVPAQSGFTDPGRYLTLTTCTPEFTSTYRLIVWGEMVEERPRSEGRPDALVG